MVIVHTGERSQRKIKHSILGICKKKLSLSQIIWQGSLALIRPKLVHPALI